MNDFATIISAIDEQLEFARASDYPGAPEALANLLAARQSAEKLARARTDASACARDWALSLVRRVEVESELFAAASGKNPPPTGEDCARMARRLGTPDAKLQWFPAQAIADTIIELHRAIAKFPAWPSDPLHAVGVLNEEVGELNKSVLQAVYEPNKNPPNAVHDEAVQAAAMALRFIASLHKYQFQPAPQHGAVDGVQAA